MTKFPKIQIPFPYRPKKKKRKSNDWTMGVVGLGLSPGSGFGNPVGDSGGGEGGAAMGESSNGDGTIYKYSAALLNLTDKVSPIFGYWTRKMIPEKSLFINEETGKDGYEDEYHVTVKYGLHDIKPDNIEEIVKGFGSIKLEFDKVNKFDTNPDFDVIKVDVKSEKLFELNKLIFDNTKHTEEFDEYRPHVTIAYVKKGECEKIIGNDFFVGLDDTIDELVFSSRTGEENIIGLK